MGMLRMLSTDRRSDRQSDRQTDRHTDRRIVGSFCAQTKQ